MLCEELYSTDLTLINLFAESNWSQRCQLLHIYPEGIISFQDQRAPRGKTSHQHQITSQNGKYTLKSIMNIMVYSILWKLSISSLLYPSQHYFSYGIQSLSTTVLECLSFLSDCKQSEPQSTLHKPVTFTTDT